MVRLTGGEDVIRWLYLFLPVLGKSGKGRSSAGP